MKLWQHDALGRPTLALICSVMALGCGSESADAELIGQARLSIAEAPADVSCVRVTAAGSRSTVRNLDVTPGQSTVVLLQGLPLGNVSFTGEAFEESCAAVGSGSVPTWEADSIEVTVQVQPPVDVQLTMRRNGRANVTVDFDDDATEPPGDPDCRDPGSWPAAWLAAEQDVIALINSARAAGGICDGTEPSLPPLSSDAFLTEAARCHSMDMAVNDFLSHTGSDGSFFVERVGAAGFPGSPRGEVLGGGFTTAAAIVNAWLDSPGHCAVLAQTNANAVGAGFVDDGNLWTVVTGQQ